MKSYPRPATLDDVRSWLRLAAEVEPLFGPMPDIETAIRRGVERGTAVVIGAGTDIEAGMLLSRDGQPHHIHWLAVTADARGQGHGIALVNEAIRRWPTGDIELETFTSDVTEGLPARRLYERLGFVCQGKAQPAPDGAPRDLYVLTQRPDPR